MTNNLDINTRKSIELKDLRENRFYNLEFSFRDTEILMTNLNRSGVLSEIQDLKLNCARLNSLRGKCEQIYYLNYFITSAEDQTKNL